MIILIKYEKQKHAGFEPGLPDEETGVLPLHNASCLTYACFIPTCTTFHLVVTKSSVLSYCTIIQPDQDIKRAALYYQYLLACISHRYPISLQIYLQIVALQSLVPKLSFSYNKTIMAQQYTIEAEDQFLAEFKHSKSRHHSLKALGKATIEVSCSKDKQEGRRTIRQPQTIMNIRFNDHLRLLRKQIISTEELCSKFGGLEFIKAELDKNQITKEDYVNYCISRLGKNFKLPSINKDVKALQSSRPSKPPTQAKNKFQYNKWFINPEERFSKSKLESKYQWNRDSFMLNIVRKRGTSLTHKYLPQFIDNCKEKLHREPLLCKYTIINQNQLQL